MDKNLSTLQILKVSVTHGQKFITSKKSKVSATQGQKFINLENIKNISDSCTKVYESQKYQPVMNKNLTSEISKLSATHGQKFINHMCQYLIYIQRSRNSDLDCFNTALQNPLTFHQTLVHKGKAVLKFFQVFRRLISITQWPPPPTWSVITEGKRFASQ